MEPVMTAKEIEEFIEKRFPQLYASGRCYSIDAIKPLHAVVRLTTSDRHLRPGGTVSGPTMMELADCASYMVILAHIGPVPLALTTNFTINFFRRPQPGDIIGDCRILKLGRRLAVVDCSISSAVDQVEVAHAMATYSIPEK